MGFFDSFKPVYNFGTGVKKICNDLGISTSSSHKLTRDDYKSINNFLNRGGHGVSPAIATQINRTIVTYNNEQRYDYFTAKEMAHMAYYGSMPFGRNLGSDSDGRILTEIFGY